MSQSRKFVSCEDSLDNVRGLFNCACTVTSVFIMVLPIHYLRKAVIKIRQTQDETEGKTELLLMSTSLTALFSFNLYEHASGYTGPPSIDTFGCVNNLMLSTILYRLSHRERSKARTKRGINENDEMWKLPSPRSFTVLMILLSGFLLIIGFDNQKTERTITNVVSSPVSMFVVYTMGWLSWNLNRKEYGNNSMMRKLPLKLWKSACILAPLVMVSVEMEKRLCDIGPIVSRLYHSIYIHIVIPLLFLCVTECSFRLYDSKDECALKVK